MNTINTYRVHYVFHLDGATKDMTALREGVSPLHVAGIESAEWSDLFDLPRTGLSTINDAAFTQVGYRADRMYLTMTVMEDQPMTKPALTYKPDTLDNQEARAHSTLLRLASEYPSRYVTYDVVLDQLNRVRDLNRMMDRDEQMDEVMSIDAR